MNVGRNILYFRKILEQRTLEMPAGTRRRTLVAGVSRGGAISPLRDGRRDMASGAGHE
jgi:hypothetical protein